MTPEFLAGFFAAFVVGAVFAGGVATGLALSRTGRVVVDQDERSEG